MWRVTSTLIEMLNGLPRKNQRIFSGKARSMETTLKGVRKRLAKDPQNPRFLQIHFPTLRHWKATMLYHQTKDPHYVQHFLGHKSLKSTEIYINIEHTLFKAGTNDQYTVKVAEKPDEIKNPARSKLRVCVPERRIDFPEEKKMTTISIECGKLPKTIRKRLNSVKNSNNNGNTSRGPVAQPG
jgi:hypothetical protein